jgi:tRNA G10  N-methylase Trm11
MYNYIFTLGRETMLCAAEADAVFEMEKIEILDKKISDGLLNFSVGKELDAEKIMRRLGGTIKISKEIGVAVEEPAESIANFLIEKIKSGKINFSISSSNKSLGIKIKKILKEKGKSARYVEPKNTATIIYNNLIKDGADIFECNKKFFLTMAVQDIESFSMRDYGRPNRDDKSGMLPPKLAMIMINLAKISQNSTLLDPFCGSGTILSEAAIMGYKNLIGTDISERAIEDTRKNMDWTIKKFNLEKLNLKIEQCDIKDLSSKIPPKKIDAIIAEPYLGKQTHRGDTKQNIEQQIVELKQMYLTAFKKFSKILKNGSVVIFIIPRFFHKNEWIKIDIENEIKKIGFRADKLSDSGPILYHRDGQYIGREIWRFTY